LYKRRVQQAFRRFTEMEVERIDDPILIPMSTPYDSMIVCALALYYSAHGDGLAADVGCVSRSLPSGILRSEDGVGLLADAGSVSSKAFPG